MALLFSHDQLDSLIPLLKNEIVVVAGGCFDILHVGHVRFLELAKNQGTKLVVLLESDKKIQSLKGENRPFQHQWDRAEILASLSPVDAVISLPDETDDELYDQLLSQIKPAIIATTKGDPARRHKERQANLIDAMVVDVIDELPRYSSTKIAQKIKETV